MDLFYFYSKGDIMNYMSMMSTKRSAKIVKSMAPWVRNSGIWVGTL